MNRVANMNPERRLKKLMSDRYENMSEERRMKKKEVSYKTFSIYFDANDSIFHPVQLLYYPLVNFMMINFMPQYGNRATAY